MKKVKLPLAVAAVAAVAAFISGVDAAGVVEFLFGGMGMMAFAGVVGKPTDTVTAADLDEANLVDQDLSKIITQFNPDRFPLDTITREYLKKKRKAKSQKVSYFEKSSKPLSDTLDASGAEISAANTDSNPAKKNTATSLTEIWIKVSTPSTWRTKDTLRMDGVLVGTGKVKHDVQFYVAEKKGAALRLIPTNGEKSGNNFLVPTFEATTILYRQGNAMAEKDMTVEAFAVVPEEREQYCQNYMAQAEESFFASLTAKKAEWDFDDMELEVIYSLRGEIELSSFFGNKFERKEGSNVTLFTNGIVNSIETRLTYGGEKAGTVTKEEYTEWMRKLFTGNSGSKERVLFAGSELVAAISLLRETYKTMSNNVSEDTSLGVRCTSIVSDFGTLKIVHHPLFDETGWNKKGVAIDLEHLTKFEFVPMKATELDLRGSGQSNVNAKVIQEVSCMILKYPDCHAIIEPAA